MTNTNRKIKKIKLGGETYEIDVENTLKVYPTDNKSLAELCSLTSEELCYLDYSDRFGHFNLLFSCAYNGGPYRFYVMDLATLKFSSGFTYEYNLDGNITLQDLVDLIKYPEELLTDTTYENATASKAGLMSAADKTNLDKLVTAWTADGDDNQLINKVEEVVKAFENAPEGTNIVTALAGKADNVEATQEAAGLMSAEDKKFLETIVIPSYGEDCTTSGDFSHAEGHANTAEGDYSHAEGGQTTASGVGSHAEGIMNIASGEFSHAEGFMTLASREYSHAEGAGIYGRKTTASGGASHAEGEGTTASGEGSHAEGIYTIAEGDFSHAEGSNLDWDRSQIEDLTVTITDKEGNETEITVSGSKAHGISSHAEGVQTLAYGHGSHAEGRETTASGDYSHAEGSVTIASGDYSHTEGFFTRAEGDYSHAEGAFTTASGLYSHAEGNHTTASGYASHAGGEQTIAGYDYQTVVGQYNDNKENTLFEVGNGAYVGNGIINRSNALEVLKDGRVKVYGTPTENEDVVRKVDLAHTHEVSKSNVAPNAHTHTVTVSGTTGNNSGSAVKAVTGYESFSGGSGNLTTDEKSTNGIKYIETVSGGSAVSPTTKYMKFSAGTTPKSKATPGHTSTNTGENSGTAITALTGVKVTAQPTVHFSIYDEALVGRVQYVQSIFGGAGALVAYDASTNGSAKTTNGNRIQYVHSLAKSGYTPAGSVSLTDGTAPSMNFNTGTKTDTPYISALTNGKYTPAGSVSLTDGTAPSMGAATTKYLHFSAGDTPAKSASFTGTAATITPTVTLTGSLSGTCLTLSTSVTGASYTPAGSVALTAGTAPSLTANTTASGGIQYVHSQGTFSAGTTPKKSASFSGTETTALVTGGTTKYMKFSAGTTPKSSASFTGTKSTDVVTGGTTYYLDHLHTAASGTTKYLGAYTSGTAVGADGTAPVAPSEHTHTYDKTTSITLTDGTAPSMNFDTKTNTDTPYISAVSGGSAVSATTKYLHHTHTGASLGTASTADVAPHTHTHNYGSSTALTSSTNSGTAVAAVTEVKASTD